LGAVVEGGEAVVALVVVGEVRVEGAVVMVWVVTGDVVELATEAGVGRVAEGMGVVEALVVGA
jgi:hypothetical protein